MGEPAANAAPPGWRDRWPAEVAQWNPQVVVVLLGAQDTFDRRIDGKVIPFDSARRAAAGDG